MALLETEASLQYKRVVDFLKVYDTYFTSANVKVYIQSRLTGKIVQVDAATGIGYSFSVSSAPVHVLGMRNPLVFSRGNGVGQGALTLIFKDVLYMKALLKHVFNEDMEMPNELNVSVGKEIPEEEQRDPIIEQYDPEFREKWLKATVFGGVLIAPGFITEEQEKNYKEYIRMANTTKAEKDKGLEQLDQRISAQRASKYTKLTNAQFTVAGAQSIVAMEPSDNPVISSKDVLDIGSIYSLFDIRIVLNNSTPYYNSPENTIVLRDCKITNEQLDTSSLQDGVIQHVFNFMFKTVTAA